MTAARRSDRRVAAARYYFSLRSPYSWLAHRDLQQHHPDVLAALEWLPFWEPGEELLADLESEGGRFLYSPMTRAKHLYILRDVRRLAAARGLSVTWPLDRAPRWDLPHVGYLVAEERGVGSAYVTRLFRARWEEGLDICDPDVLSRLAAPLGLEAGEVVDALSEDGRRVQALEVLQRIAADGVFGVPFFLAGREPYWGLDRLPDVVDTVRAASGGEAVVVDGPTALATVVGGRADEGHAGGCG